MEKIKFTVNGEAREMEVDPAKPLLWVLREDLKITGPKFGCGASFCGACTVHLNGNPIRSCIVPVSAATDKEITTIEGMENADGSMNVIQQAFQDHHGLQCGFCTPGMVMTATALLNDNPYPTEAEVRHGLEGNLCRCTGYQNIVEAIMAAAKEIRG